MKVRTRVRRVGVLIAAAALMAAVAAPAEGRALFDRHFKVVEQNVGSRELPDGLAFRSVLLNPFNVDNRVGHLRGRCHDGGGGKARCAARIHLDGAIGGFGDLIVRGNTGRGDSTLNVVDGSGDFGGRIAGKMVIKGLDRTTSLLKFDLTR
jgi:hypothetical protein